MSNQYDVIVIGAGSGGIAMAVRAAMYQQRVLVIEKADIGGTCVNVGCVPKKVMWYAAHVKEVLSKSHDYGFKIQEAGLDWHTLYQKREAYIERLRQLYLKRFKSLNIRLLTGEASFIEPHVVSVNGEAYHGQYIVIAAGATPSLPDLPGIEHAATSDDFFAMETQPRQVAVIGSGYIGVEIAGMLNQLGTEVHLFYRKALPLTGFEDMLKRQLDKQMRSDGIIIHAEHAVKQIEPDKTLVCDKGRYEGFDAILMTIGRHALTPQLNLHAVGIETRENQTIKVDAYQETNVKDHFAIGDLTGAPALTPVAIKAGRLLSERLFNQQKEAKLDISSIPTVVFSHPPIATLGLSEAQARERFERVKIYESEFNPMFEALSDKKTPSKMMLVTEGESERIVGLHMIGHGADEILQGFAVAIRMGATKKMFDETIAIHPTSAEEFVTMR